jgi:succinate-acetate transporter protein
MEALISRIACYIGVLSMIMGMVCKAFRFTIMGLLPTAFWKFSIFWLLFALVVICYQIRRELLERSESGRKEGT